MSHGGISPYTPIESYCRYAAGTSLRVFEILEDDEGPDGVKDLPLQCPLITDPGDPNYINPASYKDDWPPFTFGTGLFSVGATGPEVVFDYDESRSIISAAAHPSCDDGGITSSHDAVETLVGASADILDFRYAVGSYLGSPTEAYDLFNPDESRFIGVFLNIRGNNSTAIVSVYVNGVLNSRLSGSYLLQNAAWTQHRGFARVDGQITTFRVEVETNTGIGVANLNIFGVGNTADDTDALFHVYNDIDANTSLVTPSSIDNVGAVIIPSNGTTLVDGETITITDPDGISKTFEFDSNASFTPGNVQVAFTPGDGSGTIAAALVSAINGSGLSVTASGSSEIIVAGSSSYEKVNITDTIANTAWETGRWAPASLRFVPESNKQYIVIGTAEMLSTSNTGSGCMIRLRDAESGTTISIGGIGGAEGDHRLFTAAYIGTGNTNERKYVLEYASIGSWKKTRAELYIAELSSGIDGYELSTNITPTIGEATIDFGFSTGLAIIECDANATAAPSSRSGLRTRMTNSSDTEMYVDNVDGAISVHRSDTNFSSARVNVAIPNIGASRLKYIPALATSNNAIRRVFAVSEMSLSPIDLPSVTNVNPINGATDVSPIMSFYWSTSGAGPIEYNVYFGTSQSLVDAENPAVLVGTFEDANSFNPGILESNTTYYWKVVATNGVGSSTGGTWSFTTNNSGFQQSGNFLLYNFDPTTYGSPRLTISFDVVSTYHPIIQDTMEVHLSRFITITPAIENGEIQDGYFGSIVPTQVDGYDGYHVEISPATLMFSMPVEVRIDVSSDADSTTFLQRFDTTDHLAIVLEDTSIPSPAASLESVTEGSSFSGTIFSDRNFNVLYQLSAPGGPVITARNPPVNGTLVDRETTIQFSLHDSGGEGVNIGSLDVFVEDVQVISNGFFVPPYSGSINSTTVDSFAGYAITMVPDVPFAYEQVVSVRVIVGDNVADPAAVNTLDTTYSFTIEPFVDVIGPSPSPLMPPDGIDLDACIEFDWLDAPFGDYPNFFTLDVTIIRELTVDCITDRREDIAVVNGIAAPGYEVFATPIEIGDQKGFHVIVCPEIPFNELEIITVVINGEDSFGNEGSGEFSFSTAELTPPQIIHLDPEPNETGVDPEVAITFDIHDQGGVGVDLSRLNVNIDDGEAIVAGEFQFPYSGSIVNDRIIDEFSLDFDGYTITIERDVPYRPGSEIAVEIDGYDAYGNRATLVYDFTIAPDTTPPNYVFDPVGGTTGVNRNTLITVDVLDILGVDTSTVNISVQGQSAVSSGAAVAPFDVIVSEIITVPGVVDGYRYVIDTENDFIFNEVVVTEVSATDVAGNSSSDSSSFTTFADNTAPAVTDITPRNGQLEVSLRPEVTFTARDAYGVAFNLTSVDIGGEPVIRNGLIQSGFSMAVTPITGGTLGVDPGDGYSVIITPDADFHYNQTVAVRIEVYDRSQENRTIETLSWTTVNPAPPVFEVIPGPGDVDVAVDTNIVFEVFSDGYKVNINTLSLYIDGNPAILNNVVQGPEYIGTITTIVDAYHYRGEIDPRYLLSGSSYHSINISAEEPVSGNLGVLDFTFQTAPDAENPHTLYIGDANGVKSIEVSNLSGHSSTNINTLIDGYYVYSIENAVLNYVNRLIVGTRDAGAIFYSTNYAWPTLFYSVGDEIVRAAITDQNNGTIYLANRSRNRIDVYYNILADDEGRVQPDAFYSLSYGSDGYLAAPDGYLTDIMVLAGIFDGYFTDMVVTKGTSTVSEGSNSIFIGTSSGVFRIETDESNPGSSEMNGSIVSYTNTEGSGEYKILESTTNEIVAIDVNTETNHLYVATRSPDPNDANSITYIDLATNERSGFIPEARLIHRLMNDITFKNRR